MRQENLFTTKFMIHTTGNNHLDIILNALIGICLLVTSFIVPGIVTTFNFILPALGGLNLVDWGIKLFQFAAIYFSIQASRAAIKSKNNEKV